MCGVVSRLDMCPTPTQACTCYVPCTLPSGVEPLCLLPCVALRDLSPLSAVTSGLRPPCVVGCTCSPPIRCRMYPVCTQFSTCRAGVHAHASASEHHPVNCIPRSVTGDEFVSVPLLLSVCAVSKAARRSIALVCCTYHITSQMYLMFRAPRA